MLNVKVLHERPQVIRMGPVRSSIPIDKAPSKVAQTKVASLPKGTQSKGALTKCSPSPQQPQQKQPQHKIPFNSNVCFLCGKAGHYGNQSSCNAANKVRKAYFN
jgi:hypothetical protein